MAEDRKVFLSYSSTDKSVVEKVAQALREMKLEPWFYEQGIKPGDSIAQELNKNLAKADYFLVFWSAQAALSRWVQAELEAAFFRWADKGSVFFLPIRLDNTELPELLKPISYLDFRKGIGEGISDLRKFFGREGFGPEQRPRLLDPSPGCQEKLNSQRNMDLRLRLKSRLTLNDVREIWMDTFESRLDDDLPGSPLGIAVGEMILRADQRRVRSNLIRSICENRPDVARE